VVTVVPVVWVVQTVIVDREEGDLVVFLVELLDRVLLKLGATVSIAADER